MIASRIAAAARAAGPAIGALLEAVVLLAAVGAIAYGAWQAYPPAGPVVGGALVLVGVILRARGDGAA
jgi:hypothetical protein